MPHFPFTLWFCPEFCSRDIKRCLVFSQFTSRRTSLLATNNINEIKINSTKLHYLENMVPTLSNLLLAITLFNYKPWSSSPKITSCASLGPHTKPYSMLYTVHTATFAAALRTRRNCGHRTTMDHWERRPFFRNSPSPYHFLQHKNEIAHPPHPTNCKLPIHVGIAYWRIPHVQPEDGQHRWPKHVVVP
jgi:hypothetical protein